MKPMLSILTALLSFHVSSGVEKSCEIWSSAGPVVHMASTFSVYCTFKVRCPMSMYSGHPPRLQHHRPLNRTTIYLDVSDLTAGRTFSCDCETSANSESCGLDISAGYPPDVPRNISCIFDITDDPSKVVCSWKSGRNTHLTSSTTLGVRTFTHNATRGSQLFIVSSKGDKASLSVNSSVQIISVWVHVKNKLGSAESPVINFTLSDIVMPLSPVLDKVNCCSRNCSIRVTQRVPTRHLDIYYKGNDDEEEWTLHQDSESKDLVTVQALLPFTLYHFRAKSRFWTGLWSEWSRLVSGRTQEEAPSRALSLWKAVDQHKKSIRVYWKELGSSFARGKILEYIIAVNKKNSTQILNASSDTHSLLVPFCTKCDIMVCACNSKGCSPPANITILTATEKPPLVPDVNNQNVTLYWRTSHTAPLDIVVEWYPRGQGLDELRWVRMDQTSSHVVITDLEPFVCYDGAVYVAHSHGSVDRHVFTGVNTQVSVPTAGPFVQEREEGTTVNMTWSELPLSQRGGCIIRYTIYLQNSKGLKTYNISESQKFWVLRDLAPGDYNVCMTASTAKGEGDCGQTVKFFIPSDSQVPLIVTCGTLLILGGLCLFCACQNSTVKERFWVYFQFCRPDEIPDPANSKWAKECLQQKGKVTLHLSTSTESEEQEDLVLVDVLEQPRPLLSPQTSVNSDSEPSTPLYSHTAYIKSLSHDSYSSTDTQTFTLDTTEMEYISSHGTAAMSEEEEDMEDVPSFFPSSSFCMSPVSFIPKLTLDAVRIDGNEFFLKYDG